MAFVGVQPFLNHLHQLGFQSLTQHPDHYGDGLALGNGEITLYELVQAYATLARHGVFRPFRPILAPETQATPAQRVYSPAVSTLIAHVLADPQARQREFGSGTLLHFPVETAVKTGTSTDYRDAWALGFSHRHTVGVWMGNLTQRPTRGMTGSTGPGLVLRAVFAELHRHAPSQPLLLSPNLQSATICQLSGQQATPLCPPMTEWFLPNTAPTRICPLHQPSLNRSRAAPRTPCVHPTASADPRSATGYRSTSAGCARSLSFPLAKENYTCAHPLARGWAAGGHHTGCGAAILMVALTWPTHRTGAYLGCRPCPTHHHACGYICGQMTSSPGRFHPLDTHEPS